VIVVTTNITPIGGNILRKVYVLASFVRFCLNTNPTIMQMINASREITEMIAHVIRMGCAFCFMFSF